jgi:isopenicillin N synthase-like dioxygenase
MTSTSPSLQAFEKLPVVDIGALASGADSAARRATVDQLRDAAAGVGFLYVTNHGIPDAELVELERAAAAFFALPEESKVRYHIGRSTNHRGYVPPGEEVFYGQSRDIKEAFDLSRDLPAADYGVASRFLGPNIWPAELPRFRVAVAAYYESVFALGRRLLGAFGEALGLSATYFDEYLQKPPSQLRLIHYPPTAGDTDSMGIGAHTDYECLTILHATQPGLQVMNGNGEWVAAPPVPGAFVINIGDLLEVFSNGQFVSTSHRVVPVSAERYSFPLFFTVDYGTRVEPLPHLARGGALYPSLISGDHLLAQTMQSFRYLIALRERGLVTLPAGARELATFGRARRAPAA